MCKIKIRCFEEGLLENKKEFLNIKNIVEILKINRSQWILEYRYKDGEYERKDIKDVFRFKICYQEFQNEKWGELRCGNG